MHVAARRVEILLNEYAADDVIIWIIWLVF